MATVRERQRRGPVVSGPDPVTGPADGGVDLADDLLQPPMPDRPSRGRAPKPAVIARHRQPQQSARPLDGKSFRGHHADGREHPCGSTVPLPSSVARRPIASSVSSSRTRLRTAVSSACSAVLMAGSTPVSATTTPCGVPTACRKSRASPTSPRIPTFRGAHRRVRRRGRPGFVAGSAGGRSL